ALQLRDMWAAEAARAGGVARLEVVSWLNKVTLDIIGLAGFNYPINSFGARVADRPDELSEAFSRLFKLESDFSLLRALQDFFPIFRPIPNPRNKIARESHATMRRIGDKLLADSKRDLAEAGTFESGRARDLLTLLVRANTSKDIPVAQRRCPSKLCAGAHSSAISLQYSSLAFLNYKCNYIIKYG
ncbi:hypothetical protein B0H15DRAFT_789063, partial [Mycena belliarum]